MRKRRPALHHDGYAGGFEYLLSGGPGFQTFLNM
jgi:hypothetical protein